MADADLTILKNNYYNALEQLNEVRQSLKAGVGTPSDVVKAEEFSVLQLKALIDFTNKNVREDLEKKEVGELPVRVLGKGSSQEIKNLSEKIRVLNTELILTDLNLNDVKAERDVLKEQVKALEEAVKAKPLKLTDEQETRMQNSINEARRQMDVAIKRQKELELENTTLRERISELSERLGEVRGKSAVVPPPKPAVVPPPKSVVSPPKKPVAPPKQKRRRPAKPAIVPAIINVPVLATIDSEFGADNVDESNFINDAITTGNTRSLHNYFKGKFGRVFGQLDTNTDLEKDSHVLAQIELAVQELITHAKTISNDSKVPDQITEDFIESCIFFMTKVVTGREFFNEKSQEKIEQQTSRDSPFVIDGNYPSIYNPRKADTQFAEGPKAINNQLLLANGNLPITNNIANAFDHLFASLNLDAENEAGAVIVQKSIRKPKTPAEFGSVRLLQKWYPNNFDDEDKFLNNDIVAEVIYTAPPALTLGGIGAVTARQLKIFMRANEGEQRSVIKRGIQLLFFTNWWVRKAVVNVETKSRASIFSSLGVRPYIAKAYVKSAAAKTIDEWSAITSIPKAKLFAKKAVVRAENKRDERSLHAFASHEQFSRSAGRSKDSRRVSALERAVLCNDALMVAEELRRLQNSPNVTSDAHEALLTCSILGYDHMVGAFRAFANSDLVNSESWQLAADWAPSDDIADAFTPPNSSTNKTTTGLRNKNTNSIKPRIDTFSEIKFGDIKNAINSIGRESSLKYFKRHAEIDPNLPKPASLIAYARYVNARSEQFMLDKPKEFKTFFVVISDDDIPEKLDDNVPRLAIIGKVDLKHTDEITNEGISYNNVSKGVDDTTSISNYTALRNGSIFGRISGVKVQYHSQTTMQRLNKQTFKPGLTKLIDAHVYFILSWPDNLLSGSTGLSANDIVSVEARESVLEKTIETTASDTNSSSSHGTFADMIDVTVGVVEAAIDDDGCYTALSKANAWLDKMRDHPSVLVSRESWEDGIARVYTALESAGYATEDSGAYSEYSNLQSRYEKY